MTIGQRWHFLSETAPYILVITVTAVSSLQSFGCACTPVFNPNSELTMRGDILDADTLEELVGASVNARLSTGGEETTRGDLRDSLTGEAGAVDVGLIARGGGCAAPDLPAPDQLQVIVTIRGCEQSFFD